MYGGRYKILEPRATTNDAASRTVAPSIFQPPAGIQQNYGHATTGVDGGDTIGAGSYGVVYKARDLRTGEDVALKKIRNFGNDESTGPEGLSSSTLREITFLRLLKHENIVQLLDVLMDAERVALIFELADMDLKKYLDSVGSPLPRNLVRSYSAQLLEGLAYCHSLGIMHRDLKPQNLLLSKDGNLKIADFGMARAVTPYLHPMTVEVVTRWYRCPELLLGFPHYDSTVDVWSAACIIAEMSTGGKPLFPGRSDIDQIHRIFMYLGTPNPDEAAGRQDAASVTPDTNNTTTTASVQCPVFSLYTRASRHRNKKKLLRHQQHDDEYDDSDGDGNVVLHQQDCWEDFKDMPFYHKDFPQWQPRSWASFLPCLCPLGIDLVSRMLRYDASLRMSAAQAMDHPYIRPMRNPLLVRAQELQQQQMAAAFATVSPSAPAPAPAPAPAVASASAAASAPVHRAATVGQSSRGGKRKGEERNEEEGEERRIKGGGGRGEGGAAGGVPDALQCAQYPPLLKTPSSSPASSSYSSSSFSAAAASASNTSAPTSASFFASSSAFAATASADVIVHQKQQQSMKEKKEKEVEVAEEEEKEEEEEVGEHQQCSILQHGGLPSQQSQSQSSVQMRRAPRGHAGLDDYGQSDYGLAGLDAVDAQAAARCHFHAIKDVGGRGVGAGTADAGVAAGATSVATLGNSVIVCVNGTGNAMRKKNDHSARLSYYHSNRKRRRSRDQEDIISVGIEGVGVIGPTDEALSLDPAVAAPVAVAAMRQEVAVAGSAAPPETACDLFEPPLQPIKRSRSMSRESRVESRVEAQAGSQTRSRSVSTVGAKNRTVSRSCGRAQSPPAINAAPPVPDIIAESTNFSTNSEMRVTRRAAASDGCEPDEPVDSEPLQPTPTDGGMSNLRMTTRLRARRHSRSPAHVSRYSHSS